MRRSYQAHSCQCVVSEGTSDCKDATQSIIENDTATLLDASVFARIVTFIVNTHTLGLSTLRDNRSRIANICNVEYVWSSFFADDAYTGCWTATIAIDETELIVNFIKHIGYALRQVCRILHHLLFHLNREPFHTVVRYLTTAMPIKDCEKTRGGVVGNDFIDDAVGCRNREKAKLNYRSNCDIDLLSSIWGLKRWFLSSW